MTKKRFTIILKKNPKHLHVSPQYFHLRGGKLAESVVSVHSLGPVIGGGELCVHVLGQVGTAAEKAKQAEYPLENFRLHWAMGTH